MTAIAPLTIEGITIPHYGSVTVSEFLFLRDYFRTPKSSLGEAFQLFADFQQRQVLATLLLVSRSSPTWTLAEVAELFSVEQVYELSGFLIGEWLRWKNPAKIQQQQPTESSPDIDWEEVYWRLQLWYPGHPRFTEENFWNCPLTVIEAACDAYTTNRRRDLHLQELGIATLCALTVNINRGSKTRPVKASNFFYFDDGEIRIPTALCNGFWQLAQRGVFPQWAINLAPLEPLKQGRNGAPVPDPDYWIGEQIILLQPEIDGRHLIASLAIISCPDGCAVAHDQENNGYTIRLPDDYCGELSVIDFEVELEG